MASWFFFKRGEDLKIPSANACCLEIRLGDPNALKLGVIPASIDSPANFKSAGDNFEPLGLNNFDIPLNTICPAPSNKPESKASLPVCLAISPGV